MANITSIEKTQVVSDEFLERNRLFASVYKTLLPTLMIVFPELAHGTLHVHMDANTRVNVEYEFVDEAGHKRSGKTFHPIMAYEFVKRYAEGDEIDIIYDKEKPENNFWIKENRY